MKHFQPGDIVLHYSYHNDIGVIVNEIFDGKKYGSGCIAYNVFWFRKTHTIPSQRGRVRRETYSNLIEIEDPYYLLHYADIIDNESCRIK